MISKIWNKTFRGTFGSIVIAFKILFERITNKITTFLFINNIKTAGNNIQIMSGIMYRYPEVIEIGNNVIIGKRTALTSEGLSGHYCNMENDVSIGANCDIDFSGGITIKKKAHIAHKVLISTHNHGYDYMSNPIGIPLEIGEHAFIGSRSIIMHNCKYIGKYAVVGAGSVVTKDVPDYAIVAGNPARIIKMLK